MKRSSLKTTTYNCRGVIMASMIGAMVFTACTSVKKQTLIEQTAIVDLLNPVEVPLSKVVSQISIVPLETTEASLLHEFNPSSLWVGDETILVASNGLMQFDRTGKFIKKLIAKGEGPNEVLFTGDFVVQDNKIYMTVGTMCKVFDMDGKVVESYQIPVYPMGFSLSPNGREIVAALPGFGKNAYQRMAFFHGNQDPEIILRSPIAEEMDEESSMLGQEAVFKTNGQQVYVKEILNDTIFAVNFTDKRLEPFLFLNFGTKHSEPSKRYELSRQELMMNYPYNNIIGVNNQYVVISSLCPSIEKQQMIPSVVFYDLKDGSTVAGRLKYADNQLQSINHSTTTQLSNADCSYFYPSTMTQNGKELVAVVQPQNEDNPVLIFGTIND